MSIHTDRYLRVDCCERPLFAHFQTTPAWIANTHTTAMNTPLAARVCEPAPVRIVSPPKAVSPMRH